MSIKKIKNITVKCNNTAKSEAEINAAENCEIRVVISTQSCKINILSQSIFINIITTLNVQLLNIRLNILSAFRFNSLPFPNPGSGEITLLCYQIKEKINFID